MKQKMIVTILALIFVATVVIAGGQKEKKAEEEVAELVMWNMPLTESFTNWWVKYTDEFNAEHPNIRVKYESFATETQKTKLRAAMVADTLPDIWLFYPGTFTAAVHQEGKLVALNDLLEWKDYTEPAIGMVRIGDDITGVPLYLAPHSVYYNVNQFADAGLTRSMFADTTQPTVNEFFTAGDKLKSAGYVPISLGNADKWPYVNWVWGMQDRYGGKQELMDAITGKGSYISPGFLKAAEFAQELARRDYLPEGFNGIGGREKYALFTQGIGAISYMGPWMISLIEDNKPEGFKWDMFRLPRVPDGPPDSQRSIIAGMDAFYISSSTKHPEAAAKFFERFSEHDTAVSFMVETNNISPIKGVLEEVKAAETINENVLILAERLSKAPYTIMWWDWLLPAPVSEAHLNMSQPLSILEITPEEFSAGLEKAAGR